MNLCWLQPGGNRLPIVTAVEQFGEPQAKLALEKGKSALLMTKTGQAEFSKQD